MHCHQSLNLRHQGQEEEGLNGLILHLALKIVMRRQRRLRGEGADWEEHCDLDLLSSDDDAWWSDL